VAFQPGPDDAATLARAFGGGVKAEDLLNLEPHIALAAIVTGSTVSPAVTIATNPPSAPTGFGDQARAASLAAYGQAPTAVERDIAARRTIQAPLRPRRAA
jgi:hypothetical protein